MNTSLSVRLSLAAAGGWIVLSAMPTLAQQQPTDFATEIVQVIEEAEMKFLGLAGAMDETSYDWRPAEGIRSVGEVFLHVAGNNYFMPIMNGVHVPAGVPITADYGTVDRYERLTGKAQIDKELGASFEHLKAAARQDASLDPDRTVEFFGQERTARAVWILTLTHLHEHLGQSIAYARMNGVTPPWSR